MISSIFGNKVTNKLFVYKLYIYSDGNKNKTSHLVINTFLITAHISLKICVWYRDPIGTSIHIRLYNNFSQKKVIKKNTFAKEEISKRQFWKFVFIRKNCTKFNHYIYSLSIVILKTWILREQNPKLNIFLF